jgi:hypothetical protein
LNFVFQKTFEKQEMKSFRGAIALPRAKTIVAIT